VLAKYTEEEIIQLVRQNPGYGLLRMISELYPKKDGRQSDNRSRVAQDILIILQDHEEQTGEKLYDLIQSNEFSTVVTEAEYREITGVKYLPPGYGRATGRRRTKVSAGGSPQGFIPLPPQEFNWGEIEPAESRPSHIERFKSKYTTLNLRFPFSKFWEMWMDGYSRGEISRELEIHYQTVQKWVNRMIIFDEQETLDEWLEVVDLVTWFNEDRGLSSIEEEKDDSVMLFIHSIVDDYLVSPGDEERPDLKELAAAYRFACEAMEED